MKIRTKTLISAAFAIGLAASVSAAPPGKGTGVFKGASTQAQEDIQNLKKGDRYALAYMESKSVNVMKVADDQEVELLCHSNDILEVHCDCSEKKFTSKRLSPPGK